MSLNFLFFKYEIAKKCMSLVIFCVDLWFNCVPKKYFLIMLYFGFQEQPGDSSKKSQTAVDLFLTLVGISGYEYRY